MVGLPIYTSLSSIVCFGGYIMNFQAVVFSLCLLLLVVFLVPASPANDNPRISLGGQTTIWDGTNNQGSATASGIYFYEARTGGEVIIGKMALLK